MASFPGKSKRRQVKHQTRGRVIQSLRSTGHGPQHGMAGGKYREKDCVAGPGGWCITRSHQTINPSGKPVKHRMPTVRARDLRRA